MRWLRGSALALILLTLIAGRVGADPIDVGETPLKPDGRAYELHSDSAGTLWVSDTIGDEIRAVSPDSGSYIAYPASYPSDARPDGAGRIWFTDGAAHFGYLYPTTGGAAEIRIWAAGATGDLNLRGLEIDDDGLVWLTSFYEVGAVSQVRSFDPDSHELCAYVLPGGASSSYLVYRDGALWLANLSLQRIYRVETASPHRVSWWAMGDPDSFVEGLALDAEGRLWLADSGAGVLRRFDAATRQLTTYAPPVPSEPHMLTAIDDIVWYTSGLSATVGILQPDLVSGVSITLTTMTSIVTPTCTTLLTGTVVSSSGVSGTLTWTSRTWPELTSGGGWTIYEGREDGLPYGIAEFDGEAWVVDQGVGRTPGMLVRVGMHLLVNAPIYLPFVLR